MSGGMQREKIYFPSALSPSGLLVPPSLKGFLPCLVKNLPDRGKLLVLPQMFCFLVTRLADGV